MKTIQDIIEKYPDTKQVLMETLNQLNGYKLNEFISEELQEELDNLREDHDNLYQYLSTDKDDFNIDNENKANTYREFIDNYSYWEFQELMENGHKLLQQEELQDKVEDYEDQVYNLEREVEELQDTISELENEIADLQEQID